MTSEEIGHIVTTVLHARLGRLGFRRSEIVLDTDFDGAPIIRVKAHYDPEPKAKSTELIRSVDEIRERLLAEGESRFVYLENEYPRHDGEDGEEESTEIGTH